MAMRYFPELIVPGVIRTKLAKNIRVRREIKKLNEIQRKSHEEGRLKLVDDVCLDSMLYCDETEQKWEDARKGIEKFSIPDGTGGVNPGDRKAIYFAVNYFSPRSVLEVGTHIGASTVHIASSLYTSHIRKGRAATLTSVDIADVNSDVEAPWRKHGASQSPREMIEALGYGAFVKFVTDSSVNYSAGCDRKFDFIFLDGDHSAHTVYNEIPAALNLLNDDGVVLLHDYFPRLKPLWSDGSVVPGPFLATERLIREGLNLTVLPMGCLPWPTKCRSNVTSLALLLRSC